MKRLPTPFILLTFFFGMVLFAGGCASSLPYQRAADEGYPGYYEKHENTPGTFQIDYVEEGKSLAFAKYAAYYRAAELTYETGFRYFLVTKAYDLTKKGKSWGDPNNVAGDIPGVRIYVQCFKARPAKAVYDAYQYLNVAKVPGSDDIYSVAQRHGDESAQNMP